MRLCPLTVTVFARCLIAAGRWRSRSALLVRRLADLVPAHDHLGAAVQSRLDHRDVARLRCSPMLRAARAERAAGADRVHPRTARLYRRHRGRLRRRVRGLMAWVRSFTPAVVDTEKFMDVAFLSSIWRAPHLPPPDPWLSGEPINYYYFGHYLIALLAKALGTAARHRVQPRHRADLRAHRRGRLWPGDQYRRGDAAHGRGIAAALIPAGLASVFFVLISGNLAGAQHWWQQATQLASGVGAQRRIPGRSGCGAICGRSTTGGRRRASSRGQHDQRVPRLQLHPLPICTRMCWRCPSPRWRSSSR